MLPSDKERQLKIRIAAAQRERMKRDELREIDRDRRRAADMGDVDENMKRFQEAPIYRPPPPKYGSVASKPLPIKKPTESIERIPWTGSPGSFWSETRPKKKPK